MNGKLFELCTKTEQREWVILQALDSSIKHLKEFSDGEILEEFENCYDNSLSIWRANVMQRLIEDGNES